MLKRIVWKVGLGIGRFWIWLSRELCVVSHPKDKYALHKPKRGK
jgi:hypothetical protein